LSFLVDSFSFGSLSVSAQYSFYKVIYGVVFTRPPPHRLDQLNVSPHPHQAEVNFSSVYLATTFIQESVICPTTLLDYMVLSRANDVSCLPGRVTVSQLQEESKFLCLRIMADTGCHRCLQNLFCCSLHCVFCSSKKGEKKAKKKKKRKNCLLAASL
jgi:hypothetical protein